jgi:hypothetical protein
MCRGEIVDRNGMLFVMDPWENHFSQPIQYRSLWPTGLFARDYPHFIGKNVQIYCGGVYRFDDGLMLRLEHGPETRPDISYSEKRPIPKPRGCHRYRNGRWTS